MGSETRATALRAQLKSSGGDLSGRHTRSSWSLPIFAIAVTTALLVTNAVSPQSEASASAVVAPGKTTKVVTQELTVAGQYDHSAARDTFTTSEIAPPAPPAPVVNAAPAAGTPDPGTAQAVAWEMLQGMGWGQDQFDCLVALWNRESGWNVYAHNASSGAYGIPQALPGDKMASAGADWATNPATQVSWGLSYIAGRYATPCGAWEHSETVGWY